MKPRAKAALVLLTYVVGLNLFFLPAREGMLISIDGPDVLVMLGLVLPFVAARWLAPSQVDATRIAWYLTAVMALGIIFCSHGVRTDRRTSHVRVHGSVGHGPAKGSTSASSTGSLEYRDRKRRESLDHSPWPDLCDCRKRVHADRSVPSLPVPAGSPLEGGRFLRSAK